VEGRAPGGRHGAHGNRSELKSVGAAHLRLGPAFGVAATPRPSRGNGSSTPAASPVSRIGEPVSRRSSRQGSARSFPAGPPAALPGCTTRRPTQTAPRSTDPAGRALLTLGERHSQPYDLLSQFLIQHGYPTSITSHTTDLADPVAKSPEKIPISAVFTPRTQTGRAPAEGERPDIARGASRAAAGAQARTALAERFSRRASSSARAARRSRP
jgi:hypothetical protein